MMATSPEAAFAAALLDPDAAVPTGIKGVDGNLSARRFNVYRNNVVVSLIGALADTFPVTRQMVGEEFFAAMAQEYVTAHPPASPIMMRYGATFPVFVENFPPAAALTYLGDLSRLEFAQVEAFHAADAAPVAPETLGAIAPDQLGETRFVAHPATRLMRGRHAAASLWLAHRGIGELGSIDPFVPQDALVTRPVFSVEIRALEPARGAFLAALLDGASFGEAAGVAFGLEPDFDLPAAIALMLESGAFSDILPSGASE
jgi:hypothetical protein